MLCCWFRTISRCSASAGWSRKAMQSSTYLRKKLQFRKICRTFLLMVFMKIEASSLDKGDPMGRPDTCRYILSLNVKYEFSRRHCKSEMKCCVFNV